MDNSNNINNMNITNYNVQPQPLQQPQQSNTYGFCIKCGQKMTNPKYCLHCGTQTDSAINEQKYNALEVQEELKTMAKEKANRYSLMYYIFLIVEIIFGKLLVGLYVAGMVFFALAGLEGGGFGPLGYVYVIAIPVIAVIIYLFIVVKAFVYSLAYLKYEVRVRDIITLILTGLGLLGTIGAVLKLLFFS